MQETPRSSGSATRPRRPLAWRHCRLSRGTARRRSGKRRSKRAQRQPGFHAPQRRAEAVVQAGPEGEVPAGVAADVEPVGIGEGRLVAIGRGAQRHHHLAPTDPGARHLEVLPCEAHGAVFDRVGEAQHLLHRTVHQAGVGAQPGHLGGVVEQRHETVADQVHAGLVAGEEQQEDHAGEFVVAQVVAVLVGLDQARDQLAVGFATAQRDEPVEEARQQRQAGTPAQRAAHGLVAHLHEPDDAVVEVHAPLLRDAEHLGDDEERQRHGEVVHQVDRAAAAAEIVEHVVDEPGDPGLHLVDRAWREGLGDEAAQATVGRVVDRDHRLAHLPDQLGRESAAEPEQRRRLRVFRVGGEARVLEHAHHVVVARHHPAGAAGRDARADHRRVPAEPRVIREAIALAGGIPIDCLHETSSRPDRCPPAAASQPTKPKTRRCAITSSCGDRTRTRR